MLFEALAIAALTASMPLVGPDESERVGDPYPLVECAVAGTPFEEGLAPVVRYFDGREVKFCCENCPERFGEDLEASTAALDARIIETQRRHYPLATCVTCDSELAAGAHEFVYQNRLVKTCCVMCEASFHESAEAMTKKMDAAIIEAHLPAYPLNECVVSGESFETEVENPISFVVNNRLVRVCCNHCVGEVSDYPHEYLPKLEAAYAEAQRESYPLTTCAVSGEELGSMGDPVELIAGQTLIRLCCDHCAGKVNEDPAAYIAKVHDARD